MQEEKLLRGHHRPEVALVQIDNYREEAGQAAKRLVAHGFKIANLPVWAHVCYAARMEVPKIQKMDMGSDPLFWRKYAATETLNKREKMIEQGDISEKIADLWLAMAIHIWDNGCPHVENVYKEWRLWFKE